MKFAKVERAYYMALSEALGVGKTAEGKDKPKYIVRIGDPREGGKGELPENCRFHKGAFYMDAEGVEMFAAGWEFANDEDDKLVTFADIPQFGKADKDGGLPEIPEGVTPEEAGNALRELALSMPKDEVRELLASVNKGIHYASRKYVMPDLPSSRGSAVNKLNATIAAIMTGPGTEAEKLAKIASVVGKK